MAGSRSIPHGFGDRGLRLYKSIANGKNLSEIEVQNLVEACRISDRLERLHDLVDGNEDAWLRVKESRVSDEVVEIYINEPMKEARMHAAALRQLLAPFQGAKAEEGAKEVPSNVANIKEAFSKQSRPATHPKRSAK